MTSATTLIPLNPNSRIGETLNKMKIYICFTLSMPNRGSWNGRWIGEERAYWLVRTFSGQKGRAKAQELAAAGSHYYSWGDGWGASVKVEIVDGKEAAHRKRKTAGFCGYEWMVESIIARGKILADHEIKQLEVAQ